MPNFKCPECGAQAMYIDKGDSYTVPQATEEVVRKCKHPEERGACRSLAKEAQRLRNAGRGGS